MKAKIVRITSIIWPTSRNCNFAWKALKRKAKKTQIKTRTTRLEVKKENYRANLVNKKKYNPKKTPAMTRARNLGQLLSIRFSIKTHRQNTKLPPNI